MIIEAELKQWGNSIGVIIPREALNVERAKAGEKIVLKFKKKENPLKELWGFGKGKKLTQKARLENRKMLESKWI